MPLDPGREWLAAGITGLQRQREYYQQLGAHLAIATYLDAHPLDARPMRFDLMHRGY